MTISILYTDSYLYSYSDPNIFPNPYPDLYQTLKFSLTILLTLTSPLPLPSPNSSLHPNLELLLSFYIWYKVKERLKAGINLQVRSKLAKYKVTNSSFHYSSVEKLFVFENQKKIFCRTSNFYLFFEFFGSVFFRFSSFWNQKNLVQIGGYIKQLQNPTFASPESERRQVLVIFKIGQLI